MHAEIPIPNLRPHPTTRFFTIAPQETAPHNAITRAAGTTGAPQAPETAPKPDRMPKAGAAPSPNPDPLKSKKRLAKHAANLAAVAGALLPLTIPPPTAAALALAGAYAASLAADLSTTAAFLKRGERETHPIMRRFLSRFASFPKAAAVTLATFELPLTAAATALLSLSFETTAAAASVFAAGTYAHASAAYSNLPRKPKKRGERERSGERGINGWPRAAAPQNDGDLHPHANGNRE